MADKKSHISGLFSLLLIILVALFLKKTLPDIYVYLRKKIVALIKKNK